MGCLGLVCDLGYRDMRSEKCPGVDEKIIVLTSIDHVAGCISHSSLRELVSKDPPKPQRGVNLLLCTLIYCRITIIEIISGGLLF
jgi:hypothetical protein